jgi:hypothetical protein
MKQGMILRIRIPEHDSDVVKSLVFNCNNSANLPRIFMTSIEDLRWISKKVLIFII